MQVRIQQLGPGMMQQIQSMCGECQGQGERIDPKLRCKKCNGRKVRHTLIPAYIGVLTRFRGDTCFLL